MSDKIVAKIGKINIYEGGYLLHPKDRDQYFKIDILLDYLNLDADNEATIDNFCRKTAYVHKNLSSNPYEIFRRDHRQIVEIAKRLADNKLRNDDLKLMASRLEGFSIKVRAIPESKLSEMNTKWDYFSIAGDPLEEPLNPSSEKIFLVEVRDFLDTQTRIWEALYEEYKKTSKLRICANQNSCTKFFIPNKRKPDQRFCSATCRVRFHQLSENSKT